MDKTNIEIDKSEITSRHLITDYIIRILCLILPVIFAFIGYFSAPYIWTLLNKSGNSPEYFKLICSIISFGIPGSIIFAETRKLNPIIKITIKDKDY